MDGNQISIDLCNEGIKQKRLGNYDKCLEYYDEAKKVCKSNQDIYYNIAKVQIGLGNYSIAFKNILTYAHLCRMKANTSNFTDNIFMTEQWFTYLNEYSWDFQINNELAVSESNMQEISFALASFYSMVLDHNCSFLAGLCYILENKDLIKSLNIQDSHIEDIKNGLLGKPSAAFLKKSNISKIINSLGLFYIIINCTLIKNNIDEIPNIYFNNRFLANNNLTNINIFLKINFINLDNSYFVEKSPENLLLNTELSLGRSFLRQNFRIETVFVGYCKISAELIEENRKNIMESIDGEIPIGKVTLSGFNINSLKENVARNLNTYLCYYAIPIDFTGSLIENNNFNERDVMNLISHLHKCQIAWEGSISYQGISNCRTFKLTLSGG